MSKNCIQLIYIGERKITMEINSNLSFQARIPSPLKKTLQNEALEKGPNVLKHLNKKIRKVETLGDKNSVLDIAYDFANNKKSLYLDNKSISTLYGGSLPESKKGLLSSFMKLKKRDIYKAENEISDLVESNKNDLILKAFKNPELMKKITGHKHAFYPELRAAIDQLPEARVCDLRFGLDDYKSGDKILDFSF